MTNLIPKIGCIYVLYPSGKDWKDCEGDCYFGSTAQTVRQRFQIHRKDFRTYLNGKKIFITSFNLFEKYGIDNVSKLMLENVDYFDKKDMLTRESYYIRNFKCVNKIIPDRTKKEYKIDNKDKLREKKKEYDLINKDKKREYRSHYYFNHKEKINQYLLENKVKLDEYHKIYRLKNRDILCEKQRELRLKNKDAINARIRELYRLKKLENNK